MQCEQSEAVACKRVRVIEGLVLWRDLVMKTMNCLFETKKKTGTTNAMSYCVLLEMVPNSVLHSVVFATPVGGRCLNRNMCEPNQRLRSTFIVFLDLLWGVGNESEVICHRACSSCVLWRHCSIFSY